MLLLICLLTILVLLLTFGNRWKNRKLIKLSEQLKSDTPCWPLIGHAYKFIGNGEDHIRALQHFGREAIKNGGLTSVWMGNTLVICVADAADAEFVMKNYLDKGFLMNFIRHITGNGNIVAPVPIWRLRRKILVQTLSPKYLQTFVQIFAKNSSSLVNRLKSKAGTGPFPIVHYFTTYTMDTICEVAFGANVDSAQKNKFKTSIENSFKIVTKRMTSPWQYNFTLYKLFPSYYAAEKIKKFVDEFLTKTISAKRKKLQKKTETNERDLAEVSNSEPMSFKCFIELLMEATVNNRQYTDKEIQEEILVMFVAGFDTTGFTASYVAAMLARHPDVQEKVYKELKEVFGDSTRLATMEDLMKLEFLDAVIKETLRLNTTVPVLTRHADRDLVLPSGVTVQTNCLLLINVWALNRNPKYWGSDAEQFKPERWLDNNANLSHPARYMSFSFGPRNCPGYEFVMASLKMQFSTILRHYRLISDTGLTTDGGHRPFRLTFAISMKDLFLERLIF